MFLKGATYISVELVSNEEEPSNDYQSRRPHHLPPGLSLLALGLLLQPRYSLVIPCKVNLRSSQHYLIKAQHHLKSLVQWKKNIEKTVRISSNLLDNPMYTTFCLPLRILPWLQQGKLLVWEYWVRKKALLGLGGLKNDTEISWLLSALLRRISSPHTLLCLGSSGGSSSWFDWQIIGALELWTVMVKEKVFPYLHVAHLTAFLPEW